MRPAPAAEFAARQDPARRLFVYTAGFLTQRRVRRILQLAGWDVRLGRPGAGDHVGVWGRSPHAARGESVAARTGAPLLRVEDAFLRSVLPGRAGSPPLGLCLDTQGVHFDASTPSNLEHLLATHPLDDTALLDRARDGIARLAHWHLSKYNAFDPASPVPAPGYVLVIDQTRGDASVRYGGGSQALFDEMLAVAQIENPGARILIKTHPETRAGHRPGHYDARHEDGRTTLYPDAVSPWALMEGAVGVYTISSQLGFEAILAGHKPRVFGQPFYGGWGLTQDERPAPRRERRLTRAQLFAAAMILYPTWYDPFRDRLCEFEDAISALEAEARAWREDRHGYVSSGMRLWKRGHLQKVFGRHTRLSFRDAPAAASARADRTGRPLMVWAGKETDAHRAARIVRVEDGFLRSRGLGAELVPPLSLVTDASGIYYDPARPSDLEHLIAASGRLPAAELRRAEALIAMLRKRGLSKYNLPAPGAPTYSQPKIVSRAKHSGTRILVPGQVEDDASIRLGCDAVRSNRDLLRRTREENPEAFIVYKPHPDVEAGLRPGALSDAEARAHADEVPVGADIIDLIEASDEVWTLTSLTGFEALIRDRAVTCLGTPFYAGWGLTRDLGRVPARRAARPTLTGLAHATLIGYPRYHDPTTGLPCPVEVIVDRLAEGAPPRLGPANRLLSKAQGALASRADWWR
ncbi:capsular polysaccharide biosynthesis protein [Tranquillimonas alkanivorans]|uniref:Capsular polysaccharide export protein n=1 Tax=Tranquillimonas alkanivorans TaxID=441119 RepID=A0A1I5SLC5_9RHOB|nr:capsular polysaccharide biosynthesis protein [Tranquillimonas alkanivorans]SFP71512.1 capsular polysaccharide export protein [Tranquillimonas alkanivorans]